MKVLFVTWDSGAVDYLCSLFFPTFAALRTHGIEVVTLQATWGDDASVERTRGEAARLALPYHVVQIAAAHRMARLPLVMGKMVRAIVHHVRAYAIDVVMPRAMVPSAMVMMAAPLLHNIRIVWDADGLPADERVDFAGWTHQDPRYWAMRAVERAIVQRADAVMVRTQKARDILIARGGANAASKIRVVPNGRDAQVYRASQKERAEQRSVYGIPIDARVLISVGSLGPQYYPAEQAAIAAALMRQDPHAHVVFLTAQEALIREELAARSVDRARVIVTRVPAADVPKWLAAADVGLALRAPRFSQRAVCPLKVGEYLLSGLSVVATSGVGDLDTQLHGSEHLLIQNMADANAEDIAAWMIQNTPASDATRSACRTLGMQHFSLQSAVDGYRELLADV